MLCDTKSGKSGMVPLLDGKSWCTERKYIHANLEKWIRAQLYLWTTMPVLSLVWKSESPSVVIQSFINTGVKSLKKTFYTENLLRYKTYFFVFVTSLCTNVLSQMPSLHIKNISVNI